MTVKESDGKPTRNSKGLFVAGNKASPGRPKGKPNAVTQTLREALLQSFDEIGGTAWLVSLAQTDPGTYARLLAKLVPTETAASLEVSMMGPITEIRRTVVDPKHGEQE